MNYRTPAPVIKQICNKYVRDNMTSPAIAEWLINTGKYTGKGNLDSVASLVRKILYRYRSSLQIDKNYEEVKQILRIKRQIYHAPQSKKDVHDWETLLDNKITPKKVEHSGKIDGAETKIIIIRAGQNSDERLNLGTNQITRPELVNES